MIQDISSRVITDTNKSHIKSLLEDYLKEWDLEVQSLDDVDRHECNNYMFDTVINKTMLFQSNAKDKIIKRYEHDTKAMSEALMELEDKESYKDLELIRDYALKLQSEYNKIVVLKNRRTRECIALRNAMSKRTVEK